MSQDQPSIVEAVAVSVKSGDFAPADAAVVALAGRYADLLDSAKERAEEFGEINIEDPSAAMYRRLERLEAAVNVATVAADLGPKLLTALEALGLSPAARAKLAKSLPPVVPQQPSKPKATLESLRNDELAARRRA